MRLIIPIKNFLFLFTYFFSVTQFPILSALFTINFPIKQVCVRLFNFFSRLISYIKFIPRH